MRSLTSRKTASFSPIRRPRSSSMSGQSYAGRVSASPVLAGGREDPSGRLVRGDHLVRQIPETQTVRASGRAEQFERVLDADAQALCEHALCLLDHDARLKGLLELSRLQV